MSFLARKMRNSSIIFFAVVLVLNLLQAAFTQLTGDEALYWMHSRHLDWGFRDHPPATGFLVGLGYSLFKSELGVRLFSAFANAITLWLMYRLIQPKKLSQYILLVLSIPVLQLYGFTATPDSPLLLATALYLTIWKRFTDQQSIKNALLIGLCMAFLVWSKYHGLLVILFTLLPLKKIWLNKFFWLAAGTGIMLYMPHLLWQYQNDFPTFRYHLVGRNDDAWEFKHIGGYIGGQLLVFNPVVLLLCVILLLKTHSRSDFERSVRWLLVGVWVLFLFNSFRGRVEPHWTAPLVLAAVYLIAISWKRKAPNKVVVYGLASFIALIFAVRVGIVADIFPPLKKEYHTGKQTVLALKKIAGDKPVCFMNSYQMPSLYMFYTDGKAHSINNIEGGKNQYDLWNYNKLIHQKPFVFVASYDAPHFEDVTQDGISFKLKTYTDLPVLHQLEVITDTKNFDANTGELITTEATITNHNSYTISFENDKHSISWLLLFNYKKPNQADVAVDIKNLPKTLSAGESARIILSFVAPDRKGKNNVCLAARVDELPHTYLSNWMTVKIAE